MKGTRVIYYVLHSKLVDMNLRDQELGQTFLKISVSVSRSWSISSSLGSLGLEESGN